MDIKTAFGILEDLREGIPFEAISFLYEHEHSEEIHQRVLYFLEHAYNKDVVYNIETGRFSNAPLWYAIVAERYPSLEVAEKVVGLFSSEIDDDWDFLNEQGAYLIGLLCEHLGKSAIEYIFSSVERLTQMNSQAPYLYLLDVVKFCDVPTYGDRLMSLLEITDQKWFDVLAHEAAYFGDLRAVPILEKAKAQFEKKAKKAGRFSMAYHSVIELREALNVLEGKSKYQEGKKSFYQSREKDWFIHYSKYENLFFERMEYTNNEGADYPFFGETIVKPKKIGRNELCPCGSGKKYKKCCLNLT